MMSCYFPRVQKTGFHKLNKMKPQTIKQTDADKNLCKCFEKRDNGGNI